MNRVTVLGCGNSYGTPQIDGSWGVCDPKEPKNRRTRCSIFVESKTTRLLVDSGPDIKEQFLREQITDFDSVFITHEHFDHIGGLDELRRFYRRDDKLIDIYADDYTLRHMRERADYLFKDIGRKSYTPIMNPHVVTPGVVTIGDVQMTLFEQDHGTIPSLGVRIGPFAYSPDVVRLDEDALKTLQGVKTWIVDAGGYKHKNHKVHASLDQVYQWVDKIKPDITYLTVLSPEMDYQTLCDELPDHIRPAYDGLQIEI